MVPTGGAGREAVLPPSYEMTAAAMGTPYDYPLSSRMDENDSILVFDRVSSRGRNVFAYGDIDKVNNFFPRSGFLPRFMFQGCTRLAGEDGLPRRPAPEGRGRPTGAKDFRGVQAAVGEVIAVAQPVLGADRRDGAQHESVDGRLRAAQPRGGLAYRVMASIAYPKIKENHREHARQRADLSAVERARLQEPRAASVSRSVRARVERLQRRDRVKLMKLMWDAIGSEFGGRHELYERNYFGNHESIRFER
jgi:4-hydroxyphenylacetate 3-monooxygenase